MKTAIYLILVLLSIEATAQKAYMPLTLPKQQRKGSGVNMRPGATIYIIDGVQIKNTNIDEPAKKEIQEIKPLLNIDMPTCFTLNQSEIKTMPYTDINDMLSVFPTVYQRQKGAGLSVSGGRYEAMLYVLDGVVLML